MEKEIVNQVQETQRVPFRISPRRNKPQYILIKITKIKHKEKILKAARETMVLAQKQKYRPMEKDRKPRNKLMHLWVPYF